MAIEQSITIRGAREHNLKDITVVLPRNKLICITGLSGSGKSSLAFDTLYAEGQRRYVESLSAYARQFLGQMEKPDVDGIDGLSPAISIDQKTTSRNPRSTVGTVTEIYDYLRLLYARIGHPHCPECGRAITGQSAEQIVDQVLRLPEGTKFTVDAPIVRGRKGEFKDVLERLRGEGFTRVKIDGETLLLEDEIVLDKKFKHDLAVVVDRLVLKDDLRRRLTDSVETALQLADGLLDIAVVDGETLTFSERFACPDHGVSLAELAPRVFSFNSPHGACAHCHGLGSLPELDPELVQPDPAVTIEGGRHQLLRVARVGDRGALRRTARRAVGRADRDPAGSVPAGHRRRADHGDLQEPLRPQARVQRGLGGSARQPQASLRRDGVGAPEGAHRGVDGAAAVPRLPRRSPQAGEPRRHGRRPLHSVEAAIKWSQSLDLSPNETLIADRILREIVERLSFLNDVGVGYLSLNRGASTLSGGEAQRIRLATQIGSSLVGVLYILDEPSIGLHQRDNHRLLGTLTRLRDLGNTVIVVEHDEDTMRESDWLVDMGPGAGEHGGRVVAAGTPKVVMKSKDSVTGQFLSGRRAIAVPERRPPADEFLVVRGAREHNLKDIDAEIPVGRFVTVTGVSGSGKSTLVNDVVLRSMQGALLKSRVRAGAHSSIEGIDHFDKVIAIDQSPIGRTPRSNPATYTGVFDHIRQLYADTPDAKTRGYKQGRFSFNVKGGRCEACRGDGTLKIEMHFLPDIYVPCEICGGRRYNKETLEVRFKGKSIADVLEMPIEEALTFFSKIPKLRRRLQTLHDVGLDYVRLGQPATTLSGGEAQRVKLATELAKVATGRTLYVLDEPTTGLHMADVEKLLHVLQRLVDTGNTVLVIEHNLDVIKQSDWLIDLGPEGGEAGGEVLAVGTPEQVAKVAASHTGRFLIPLLAAGKATKAAKVPA